MDGRPEGTGRRPRGSRPRWLVALTLVFAIYLGIRLVQGVVWLVGLLA